MGEQAGAGVSGSLYYVPHAELVRARELPVSKVEATELFAALCRINTLYMIARAGSGHIGSSFSSLDMMSWLLLNEVPLGSSGGTRDVFFSSKGHDAPALYSVYLGLGLLPFDSIHRLRKLDGLPGHPDVGTPNIVTNTGSLGMGVSKAKGMILARRLSQRPGRVFVLTGDGELQEGQFWESLVSAANHEMHELTVIVDHNKMQSDTLVSKVSDLGDLAAKLDSFGWHVSRCDGNDVAAFAAALAAGRGERKRPKAIIADTVKGKGVSFMEHTAIDSDVELYKFHSGAPSDEAYVRAVTELIAAANAKLAAAGAGALTLERVDRQAAPAGAGRPPQRLIPAYSAALLEQAERNPKIVALDADLVLDTGLIPFQKRFPERFVECGIAEQDMVSQAGGMALGGLLPVVHSFACFLSTRPNEQIYNNATEHTKIVYVASLAGVVPGGPGHSHQAVRDIGALAAVPGLALVEPSCEAEVGMLLDWCLNRAPRSSYLRLVSIPVLVPYTLPPGYAPDEGRGVALTAGRDVAVIGYGPVLLSAACEAARQVAEAGGPSVKVINLPWLNTVDGVWLREAIAGCKVLVTLDNHYAIGGQGDRIAAALAAGGVRGIAHVRVALEDVPVCGANAEVLREHGLDAEGIARVISGSWRG